MFFTIGIPTPPSLCFLLSLSICILRYLFFVLPSAWSLSLGLLGLFSGSSRDSGVFIFPFTPFILMAATLRFSFFLLLFFFPF